MRTAHLLASLCLGAMLSTGHAAAPPAAALSGTVLESRDVDSYTYLRLRTPSGEVWAAVPSSKVALGARVTIARPMMMANFESKSLGRRFDQIAFGVLDQGTAPAGSPHGSKAAASPAVAPVAVAKAGGPDGRTVAEVVTGRTKLKDRSVAVRGQVVKFNAAIMGKNWVHLRDGSGSAADGSNDILVTTADSAAVGDIVTVSGTVRTGVDLGSGYRYEVLIDGATLRKP